MNDIQKSIAWFLIVLLIISHVLVNNIAFLKMHKQENANNIKALSESIEDLKILLDYNQSRLEKKVFDFRKALGIQSNQTENCDIRYKDLARLLLLVIKMKNSLLQEIKFDDHINEVKSLIIKLNDQDIEETINVLENVKEVYSLYELKLYFEKTVDIINYNQSTLLQKIITNWIKVKNKNDPFRAKWIEIEDSINQNNWQNVDIIVSNLTNSEFKQWLNKLNNFISTYKNILIIYNHLLYYIS
ncbi:hypothetical protein [Wolbachia endosymbiont of Chironomus riparius]|uniref:hypothetical protein n=1 Tax=Wolbachia endosymbiont of Chironomus riparius TaxID=2883238 RepID=UPI0020A0CCE3|nr:hypothetical protein [Wolbachia endosymbiont of Chironomus riparius]